MSRQGWPQPPWQDELKILGSMHGTSPSLCPGLVNFKLVLPAHQISKPTSEWAMQQTVLGIREQYEALSNTYLDGLRKAPQLKVRDQA